MFHTSIWVHSSGLSGVFGEIVMNELDNVVSNGSGEDLRGSHFSEYFAGVFVVEYTDCWSHEIYKEGLMKVCLS